MAHAPEDRFDDIDAPAKPWRSAWELDPDIPAHGPLPKPSQATRPMRPTEPAPDDFSDIARAVRASQGYSMLTVVLLALAAFAASLGLWALLQDEAPVWDDDLLPHSTAPGSSAIEGIPRAAERLRLALESTQPLPGDLPLATAIPLWSTPALAKTAAENSVLVETIADLANESEWEPAHPAWVAHDLGNSANWTALTTVCAVTSVHEARLKNDAQATSVGLDLVTLGHRLRSISTLPTYYARSLELHRIGCIVLAYSLQGTSLSATDLERAQADTQHCGPTDEELQNCMNDFYRFEKGLIIGPLSEQPVDMLIAGMMAEQPGRLFFKPNVTIGLFTTSFRELKDQLMRAPYLRTDQITARIGPAGRPNAIPGHPNYAGIKHANQRIWAYEDLLAQQSLARARQELLVSYFAIRRYGAVKGVLPPSLDALVAAKLLDKVPIDPFTGESIIYDLKNGVLYSVGQDRKNEGGRATGAPLSDDSEPTISMSVK